MKTFYKSLAFALAALFIIGCSRDDENLSQANDTQASITASLSKEIKVTSYKNLQFKFKELNTGKEISQNLTGTNSFQSELEKGTYEIKVEGEVEMEVNEQKTTSRVSGYIASYPVSGNTINIHLELYLVAPQTDFVIEEIFFTGTLTPEGKQYDGDKYFKIRNNTDKVLYADGLMISQSEFLTVEKQDYRPNIMNQAHAVRAIIMLPGNGTQYPVQPGDYILIADTAINHKEFNSKSIDLRGAHFEIYNEGMDDVDNPNVPNTINIYDEMLMHNRGFTGYAISRLPSNKTPQQYLAENKYQYGYDFVFNGVTYPMENDAYSIPNDWIVDAVNLSVASEFQWVVTAPSLDNGWSYCGKANADETRYGKSVIRKTLGTNAIGKPILMDTNNSTVDFTPEAKPSLF